MMLPRFEILFKHSRDYNQGSSRHLLRLSLTSVENLTAATIETINLDRVFNQLLSVHTCFLPLFFFFLN